MAEEHAAGGGWEAALDGSLAARLLRPAVRPGISDPSHGRGIAARLLRATAPSLADDVARRYGASPPGGARPPVVHAVPLPPPDGEPAGAGDAPAPPAPAAGPVVRAGERAAEPAFPPVRPLGAAPAAQRAPGDAAAPLPVVPSRRPVAEAQSRGEPPAAATVPVVQPAPTRLQRRIADERAEAAAAVRPAVPQVRGSRAGSGSPAAPLAVASPAPPATEPGGVLRSAAAGSPPHPLPVGAAGPEHAVDTPPSAAPVGVSPPPGAATMVQRARAVEGGGGTPLPRVHPVHPGGAAGPEHAADTPLSAASGAISSPHGAATMLQRAQAPEGGGGAPAPQVYTAPTATPSATSSSPAVPGAVTSSRGDGTLVQRTEAPHSGGAPAPQAHPLPTATPPSTAGPAGAPEATGAAPRPVVLPAGSRPAMAERSVPGGGGLVQRAPAGRGAESAALPGAATPPPSSAGAVRPESALETAGVETGRDAAPARDLPVVTETLIADKDPGGRISRQVHAPAGAAEPGSGTTGGSAAVTPSPTPAPGARTDAGPAGAWGMVQRAPAAAEGHPPRTAPEPPAASAPAPVVAAAAVAAGPARPGGALPVVAAGSTRGAAQRAPLPGAGRAAPGPAATRLVHAAPVAAQAAPEAVRRQEASAAPPPGSPPPELPTATASGTGEGGAGEVRRIADQVYDLLVRRMDTERKQRGL